MARKQTVFQHQTEPINNVKRQIGVFFRIDNKLYTTSVDYRSKEKFKKLLEGFSKNAKMCDPQPGESFTYINLCDILTSAHNNLDKKQRATKLIFTIMAQNSCTIFNG